MQLWNHWRKGVALMQVLTAHVHVCVHIYLYIEGSVSGSSMCRVLGRARLSQLLSVQHLMPHEVGTSWHSTTCRPVQTLSLWLSTAHKPARPGAGASRVTAMHVTSCPAVCCAPCAPPVPWSCPCPWGSEPGPVPTCASWQAGWQR